jgi:hypothetical protein
MPNRTQPGDPPAPAPAPTTGSPRRVAAPSRKPEGNGRPAPSGPPSHDEFVLDGDYRYLSEAYYRAVDAVNADRPVRPTPQEALDAAIVPLSLIRAEHAGLPTPEWYLTNEYFRPPVLAYTVNPFMRRFAEVRKAGRMKAVARSLTRNFQYAICCQEIEEDTAIREFNCLLGRVVPANAEWAAWAARVWEVFRLPLVRVRLLDFAGRRVFSALEPLTLPELKPAEKKLLAEAVREGDGVEGNGR